MKKITKKISIEHLQDEFLLSILIRNNFNQVASIRTLLENYDGDENSFESIRYQLQKKIKKSKTIFLAYKKYKKAKKTRDFNELHPMVKKQFIRGVDKELSLKNLTKGSHDSAYFLCKKCDSEFDSVVKDLHRNLTISQTKDATGCPFCSGKRVNEKNNFGVLYPEYQKYWDYKKNSISPYEVTPGNDKKFWFKCERNHSFDIALCNLTHNQKPRWCPECKLRGTSYLEIIVYWELHALFGDLVVWQKKSKLGKRRYGVECDILINFPQHVICIEVDGAFHSSQKASIRDMKKNALLTDHGVNVIRLREERVDKITPKDIIYSEKQSYKSILDNLIDRIKNEAPIELYYSKICKYFKFSDLQNLSAIKNCYTELLEQKKYIDCFLEIRPDLEKYWDVEKNLPYKPHMFSKGSHKIVHWKCPKCKSTEKITIKNMVKRSNPCIRCWEEERGLTDYQSSIENLMPEVLKIWDYKKNIELGLDPCTLSPWSEREAHWICSIGHEHITQIKIVAESVKSGYPGCKYCKHNRTIKDVDGSYVSLSQLIDRIKSESGDENISSFKARELCKLGLDASHIRAFSKLSRSEKLGLSLLKKGDLAKEFKLYLKKLIYSILSQKVESLDGIYRKAIEKCQGNVSKAERLLGLRKSAISDYYRKYARQG